ncbi:MAG: OmpA family protein, partial [Firmicutes bacterium]|nr:OmpA family protein [Bacillota bacterium]
MRQPQAREEGSQKTFATASWGRGPARNFAAAALALACVGAAIFISAPAVAAEKEPGKDHPLVGRYEGAKMLGYRVKEFDEADMIQGPAEREQAEVLHLEGKVSHYSYEIPKDRSLLEVQRNYEASLKSKGLEPLFACSTKDGSCFKSGKPPDSGRGWDFGRAVAKKMEWPTLGVDGGLNGLIYDDAVYMLLKRTANGGTAHVGLLIGQAHGQIHVLVRVVESKAMDQDKIIFISATEMQKNLESTGRVNIYGIHFDTDKDAIKPESQPTLDEMSKLMRGNPRLRLQVVGHTDSQGDDAHNKDLSNRRSISVIGAITKTGIDPRRFSARGAGASEPVAPNDTPQGRAQNR